LKAPRGLVVGIANAQSIAFGCAQALREAGAELAVTWLNEKAAPHVRPLAEQLGASIAMPLDVEAPGQLEAVFARIAAEWGRLDFLIHAIAFAPRDDLHGRVVDCSAAGFARAMDVSCHSFLRMAKLAEPLMDRGGALVTMSYHGADEVTGSYALMGPVKAALQSAVRYLAVELAPRNIRVFAVSPGPLRTRAAGGIAGFDALVEDAIARAPLKRLATIAEVGALTAFLCGDGATGMTGQTIHVDAGLHIIG